MKMIYCNFCGDIYNVDKTIKTCSCGKTKALYINDENIIYGGDEALCLGLDNNTFEIAKYKQVLDGFATRFDSYVCAYFTESTIKVKNLENMSEEEIYNLYGRTKFSKKWDEKIKKKRTGLGKFLYLLCKKIMSIEINKADEMYLNPHYDKWYIDFTHRVLQLSKRLATITGRDTQTKWFDCLLSVLFNDTESFLDWEEIEDNEKLYDTIAEYFDKLIDIIGTKKERRQEWEKTNTKNQQK